VRDLGVVQKHSKPNHPTTCGRWSGSATNVEEMAHSPAQLRHPIPSLSFRSSVTLSLPAATTPGRTARWTGAPRWLPLPSPSRSQFLNKAELRVRVPDMSCNITWRTRRDSNPQPS